MDAPSHSYGTSPAIRDHSVTCHPTQMNAPRLNPSLAQILARFQTWHVQTCAAQHGAGTRFTYPGGMEGWVDLGYPALQRPGVELAIFRSPVRHPSHYTTEPNTTIKLMYGWAGTKWHCDDYIDDCTCKTRFNLTNYKAVVVTDQWDHYKGLNKPILLQHWISTSSDNNNNPLIHTIACLCSSNSFLASTSICFKSLCNFSDLFWFSTILFWRSTIFCCVFSSFLFHDIQNNHKFSPKFGKIS